MADVMVVGLDVGGTSTRAAAVASTGARCWAPAGPAAATRPVTAPTGRRATAAALRAGTRRAGSGSGPGRHHRAGRGRPAARRSGRSRRLRRGLAGRRAALRVRRCTATPWSRTPPAPAAPDGTVLIAGTGAIAVEVRGLTAGPGRGRPRLAARRRRIGLLARPGGGPPHPGRAGQSGHASIRPARRTRSGALGTAVLTELLGSAPDRGPSPGHRRRAGPGGHPPAPGGVGRARPARRRRRPGRGPGSAAARSSRPRQVTWPRACVGSVRPGPPTRSCSAVGC